MFLFSQKEIFFSFLVDFNFSFGNLFRLTEVAWIRKVQRLLPAVFPDIKYCHCLPLSLHSVCLPCVVVYVYIYVYAHILTYSYPYLGFCFLSILRVSRIYYTCACPKHFVVYFPRTGISSNHSTVVSVSKFNTDTILLISHATASWSHNALYPTASFSSSLVPLWDQGLHCLSCLFRLV